MICKSLKDLAAIVRESRIDGSLVALRDRLSDVVANEATPLLVRGYARRMVEGIALHVRSEELIGKQDDARAFEVSALGDRIQKSLPVSLRW